jgi:type IV pilus assembly protein PilB
LRQKLGECLVQAGLVTRADLRLALTERRRTGEHIGVVLVRRKLATEKQIAQALAAQLGYPFVSLDDAVPNPTLSALIPRDIAREHACEALELSEHVLTVAMADPLLFGIVQEVEDRTGYRVRPVVAARSDILGLVARLR